MVELVKTDVFNDWFEALRDIRAKARIGARLDRFAAGNQGDAKPVGDGVSELRIDYGPGYRVYFAQRGILVAILLCGGDKRTQESDIAEAKRLALAWSNS